MQKKSPRYFVYILQCDDSTLYTGITTDIERRLAEHKAGIASHYTSARGARKILYSEPHRDRSSALKREAAIKRMTRSQKKALISR